MATPPRYFTDLHALLKPMPPGAIDMDRFEAHERRYGHRFADPPEYVERWLLAEEERLQGI